MVNNVDIIYYNELQNLVLDDLNRFKLENRTYLYRIFNILTRLQSTRPISGYEMPDLIAMVGMILDECEYYKVEYKYTYRTMKKNINKYARFCKDNNLKVCEDNYRKFKNYKGDGKL